MIDAAVFNLRVKGSYLSILMCHAVGRDSFPSLALFPQVRATLLDIRTIQAPRSHTTLFRHALRSDLSFSA